MDNILLGQGRKPGDRDAYETLNRMAHVFSEPLATHDPNASENPPSTSEQVISSPTHIHHPSPLGLQMGQGGDGDTSYRPHPCLDGESPSPSPFYEWGKYCPHPHTRRV
ncbi:hypothetical protein M5689_011159 [Euphorbia peplus]|nr:hypothetical protein M5689_011159 [Euphorbia peplus]